MDTFHFLLKVVSVGSIKLGKAKESQTSRINNIMNELPNGNIIIMHQVWNVFKRKLSFKISIGMLTNTMYYTKFSPQAIMGDHEGKSTH